MPFGFGDECFSYASVLVLVLPQVQLTAEKPQSSKAPPVLVPVLLLV